MGKGFAWLDTSAHDSLLEGIEFIKVIEKRQGLKIVCIEENAFDLVFIDKTRLEILGEKMGKTEYGKYLISKSKK